MTRLAGWMTLALLVPLGCRTAYYSVWEQMGKDKRDLLRDNVMAARNDQKEAGEEIQDALERLRATYGSTGSDLEKHYDRLKSEFDEAKRSADAVGERIERLHQVATDLFDEWEEEAKSITSADLRTKSRRKLGDTKQKYEELHASLKRSEATMKPVLVKFNDHVLYLKHSLNAQSLGTLEKESREIEREVQRLLGQMKSSISQSDSFLRSLQDDS